MTREAVPAATPLLFVAGDPDGREEQAARARVATHGGFAVTSCSSADLAAALADAPAVVWVHAAERAPQLDPEALAALAAHTTRAGVLLSLFATGLVVPLGLETSAPNRASVEVWHDDGSSSSDRGVHAWGPHPLVGGLGRGALTWRGTEGERVGQSVYAQPRWPHGGRVALVERTSSTLDADVAVAWDYTPLGRRVVCVGAHLHFAANNRAHDDARDRLLANALRMVAHEAPARAVWWPGIGAPAGPLEGARFPAGPLGPALPEVGSAITLSGAPAGDSPFALAGRRAVVVGGERSGVGEVWAHPLCVLRGGVDLRVDGEPPEVRSVDVSPEQVVRHLTTRTRFVEERVFVPLDEGAVTLEYRYRRLGKGRADAAAPRVELRLRVPLRLDAPLPAGLLHPLRFVRTADGDVTSVAIVGRDEHYAAVVRVEGTATVSVVSLDAEVRLTVSASLAERLRVTLAGSALGRAGLDRTLTAVARRGWRGLATRRAERAATLQHDHLALRTPSASLDTALEWAKARLGAALVTVPDVGTGAVVGYAPDPGAADQPGHWFGAADACEVGHALLACGLFAEAKAVLDFVALHTGGDGVPHDVTTAGFALAVDPAAAPLFLRFVVAYDAWTADASGLRGVWPSVTRVLAAPGAGEELEPKTAALWADAAARLGPLAARLGDPATAARCEAIAARARDASAGAAAAAPSRRPDAFRHALDLALACYEGARGAFPGESALGGGGTRAFADSPAAAARLVSAVVGGLLGAEPDAGGRRVRLMPGWPREWAHATVHRLRIGAATLELEAVEGCLVDGVPHDGVTYRVRSVPAGALTLTLEHPVGERRFAVLRVDGADADAERCGTPDQPHVRVTRWLAEPVELQFVGDAIGDGE